MLGFRGLGSKSSVVCVLLMLACYFSSHFSLRSRCVMRIFKGSTIKKVLSILTQKPNVFYILQRLNQTANDDRVTVMTQGENYNRPPGL